LASVHHPEEGEALFSQRLHETQGWVWQSWANEILYGGAKGGGKSFLIRFCFCMWAIQAPGVQCYLFRRTHPDLWANHMEGPSGFPMMLAPLMNADVCDIVGKEVRWANGSLIKLNHLQLEKHVTKYQGIAIHALGMDELTQFSETQYRYLLGSVRLGNWKPPPELHWRFPVILNGANPGGIGHDFVKERFIDHGPYIIKHHTAKGEGGTWRQFIPARAEDNPELLKNDPDYLERVEAMGHPELVRAMREGDWEIVIGSMFGYIWRKPRHVLAHGFPIPVSWDIWRGGDDGFKAPASVHWFTQDPDTKTFYVINEIYQTNLLPEEFADKIHEHDYRIRVQFNEGDVDVNDMELDGEMDSAAFAKTGANERGSRAEQMNALGCNWRAVAKPTGSRVMRVQMMHKVLAPNPREELDPNGIHLPGLQFFPSCANAIRTIPKLVADPDNMEDIDTDMEDHAFDSITYGLTRRKIFFEQAKARGV